MDGIARWAPLFKIHLLMKLFVLAISSYVCALLLINRHTTSSQGEKLYQQDTMIGKHRYGVSLGTTGESIASRVSVNVTTTNHPATTLVNPWKRVIDEYIDKQRELCIDDWKEKNVTKQIASNLLCDCIPKTLLGPININFKQVSLAETLEKNKDVIMGGHWEPVHCFSLYKVVIVIPCRGRLMHLTILLRYLHPMLQGQQANYTIVVVDQESPAIFNKAALMNVGFLYAVKEHDADCVIFHDVDFLPEDGRHLYRCRQEPVHLGAYNLGHDYKIMYGMIFGGVTAFPPKTFITINGFSNRYFGWGGEDDDMWYRLRDNNIKIHRNPREVAGYNVIKHKRDRGNRQPNRTAMLRHLFHDRDSKHDGLNTLSYKFKKIRLLPLYTWLLVDILDEKKITSAVENTTYIFSEKFTTSMP